MPLMLTDLEELQPSSCTSLSAESNLSEIQTLPTQFSVLGVHPDCTLKKLLTFSLKHHLTELWPCSSSTHRFHMAVLLPGLLMTKNPADWYSSAWPSGTFTSMVTPGMCGSGPQVPIVAILAPVSWSHIQSALSCSSSKIAVSISVSCRCCKLQTAPAGKMS